MDSSGKNDKQSICLFKKKGKVKALDEELYSESRSCLLSF